MIAEEDLSKIQLEEIAKHIVYRKSLDFDDNEDILENVISQESVFKIKPSKLDSKTLDLLINDNLDKPEVTYNAQTDLNLQIDDEDALEEKLFYTEHNHTKLKLEFIDEVLQNSVNISEYESHLKPKTTQNRDNPKKVINLTNQFKPKKIGSRKKKAYSYLSHDKDEEDYADEEDSEEVGNDIKEPKWEKDVSRIMDIINKEIEGYNPEEIAQEEKQLLSLFTSSIS